MCRVDQASRKLVQFRKENLQQQRFLVHCRKGREIETQTLCIRWKIEKNPKHPWTESWLGRPRRDDGSAKIVWSWAEVEARNREKRNSDFAFQEINQDFESQRFQLHQASRWADQAQRDKKSLYGELELRNGLFQENHARDCSEIQELRSICWGILRLWVRWWLKFGIYATMWIPRPMQENFTILNQGATLEQPTFLIKLLRFWVPGTLPGCDSGLPRDTRNCKGIMGNVFERPPVQEGLTLHDLQQFKNSASSSRGLRPGITETARREGEMKRESFNTSIQSPHFQNRSGMLNHTGGTYSHNGMNGYWDHALLTVSEMPSGAILEGLYKSKITEFCSTSDCDDSVWSRSCTKQWRTELWTIKDSCKTSHWSDDENSKLQSPERCCGTRISYQESRRKQSQRWEESGSVFSVEGTWTMFQRRLL